MKETFDLRVNNSSLNTLKYLDSGFQLSNDKVVLYKANTKINKKWVTTNLFERDLFEYQSGILTHKIL